jgi:hygromycin-B 7''-O-kinase
VLLSVLTYEQYKSIENDNVFWGNKINEIVRKEALPKREMTRFSFGSNIVYSYNHELVIKLYPSFFKDEYNREIEVLLQIQNHIKLIEVPKVVYIDSFEGWPYLIMTELKGSLLIDVWEDFSDGEKVKLCKKLGKVVNEFHQVPTNQFNAIDINWGAFIKKQYLNLKHYQKNSNLSEELMDDLDKYVEEVYIDYAPESKLLTGEYTPFNLLVNKVNGKWSLTGIIDFADCFLGDLEYDLLGPLLFIFKGNKEMTNAFLNLNG